MDPANYDNIDQALLPLHEFISSFTAGLSGTMNDDDDIQQMSIESVTLDLPIEIDAVTDNDGRLILGGGPPTQIIETTFMPVFNRLRVVLEPIQEEQEGADGYGER